MFTLSRVRSPVREGRTLSGRLGDYLGRGGLLSCLDLFRAGTAVTFNSNACTLSSFLSSGPMGCKGLRGAILCTSRGCCACDAIYAKVFTTVVLLVLLSMG